MRMVLVIFVSVFSLLLTGCGGGSSGGDTLPEALKDKAYYSEQMKKATSMEALRSEDTVVFTMETLERYLTRTLPDENVSVLLTLVYQVQQQLAAKVVNINGFSLDKKTPIILKKGFISNGVKLQKKVTNEHKKGLIYEIDRAALKVLGHTISAALPDDIETVLNRNTKVSGEPKRYLSVAPKIEKEIACPPSGVCRDRSPMEEWKRGGLAEVQTFRHDHERELDVVLDGNSTVETRMNGAGKTIELGRRWISDSYGYTIEALNYDDGTSSIRFSGNQRLIFKDVSFQSYEPFAYLEGFEAITIPNNNQQQAVCLTDGSWASSGDTFYIITKSNHYPWSVTYGIWTGASHLNDILNIGSAAEALDAYRSFIAQSTSDPLPPQWGPYDDIPCTAGNPFGTVADASAEPEIDPMHRVSMHTVAMNDPSLSGQDIYNFFRSEAWGNNPQDVRGLSMQWLRTLNSLGIINGPQIAQNIKDQWRTGIDGRFIFRRVEIDFHPVLELLPVDESREELLILPKPILNRRGSYPTNLKYGYSPRELPPVGALNPNYCRELDSVFKDTYIPTHLVDPEVLLELTEDVEFLTYAQLNRLQDEMKLPFWGEYNKAVNNGRREPYMGYGEIPGLVYPARKRILQRDGLYIGKNEAYYTTLIDRLIILNPLLNGNLFNHPCFQSGVVNPWFQEEATSY